MTDRNKFEQMLEYLISEDQEKARELFHQLVVEKSREIYENILAEDFEEEGEVEENFEFDEAGEIGGDATDDFMSDVEADDEFGGEEDEFGGEEEGEGDIEDRVVDLEDALDELKAEFEKLMSDEEGEESEEEDEEGEMDFGDEEDEEDEEQPKEDFMREYVEKVTAPKMGDNGANAKSIVAKKNDMGGTTANLRGGESKGEGTKGGLLNPSTKEDNAGNVNVPGAKKAATLSKVGAPKMGDDGANTNSPLNGAPKRAK
jgi:hypothetical protein